MSASGSVAARGSPRPPESRSTTRCSRCRRRHWPFCARWRCGRDLSSRRQRTAPRPPGSAADPHAVDTAVLRLSKSAGRQNRRVTVIKRGYRLAIDELLRSGVARRYSRIRRAPNSRVVRRLRQPNACPTSTPTTRSRFATLRSRLATDLGHLGDAQTAERRAGLVHREYRVAVGIAVDQHPQRRVQHGLGSWRNIVSAMTWLPIRYSIAGV